MSHYKPQLNLDSGKSYQWLYNRSPVVHVNHYEMKLIRLKMSILSLSLLSLPLEVVEACSNILFLGEHSF